jgi:hypothetical protein
MLTTNYSCFRVALWPNFAMICQMMNEFLNGLPYWVVLTFAVASIWSLCWKGVALWKAAQLSHKRWFVVLLLVNTFGILDIIYIRFIATKYVVETVEEK